MMKLALIGGIIMVAFVLWLSGVKNPIAKRRFDSKFSRFGAVVLCITGVVISISYWGGAGYMMDYYPTLPYNPIEWGDSIYEDHPPSYIPLTGLAKISFPVFPFAFLAVYFRGFYTKTIGRVFRFVTGK